MVKHTQTIRWLLPTNSLSVFDHFVGLALKGLILIVSNKPSIWMWIFACNTLAWYLFVRSSNGNTRKMYEICSELTLKIPERCH